MKHNFRHAIISVIVIAYTLFGPLVSAQTPVTPDFVSPCSCSLLPMGSWIGDRTGFYPPRYLVFSPVTRQPIAEVLDKAASVRLAVSEEMLQHMYDFQNWFGSLGPDVPPGAAFTLSATAVTNLRAFKARVDATAIKYREATK